MGLWGEICIEGICVGKLSGNDSQNKLFRTGDLGMITENGLIVNGRINGDFIKINGRRVPSDRIEQIVSSIDTVTNCICLEANNVAVLFVYGNTDEQVIRKKLSEILSRYQQPDDYFFCKEWPINQNGKTDRKKLLEFYKLKNKDKKSWHPRENNKEKVELLIKKGAVPTLNNPIKFAKDLDMIKILVKNGCELTNEVLNTIINDLEAMKFVLQNGIDANFEKGYPLRAASRNQNLDVVKLLVTHGANVAERRYMVVKQCIEYATNEILKYLLDELESGDANFKNPVAKQKLFAEWIGWCSTSLQTTPEQKENNRIYMINYREKHK
jgi:hypothetical protein